MYPELPVVPPQNYHNLLFDPKIGEERTDHTLVVDAVTGRKRSYLEVSEYIVDAATALGSSICEKGLALNGNDGEVVGILSENCMV